MHRPLCFISYSCLLSHYHDNRKQVILFPTVLREECFLSRQTWKSAVWHSWLVRVLRSLWATSDKTHKGASSVVITLAGFFIYSMNCVVFGFLWHVFLYLSYRYLHLSLHSAVRSSQWAHHRARSLLCVLAQCGGSPHPDTDSCHHGWMDHEHLLGNGHGHPGKSVAVKRFYFSVSLSIHLSFLFVFVSFCLSVSKEGQCEGA